MADDLDALLGDGFTQELQEEARREVVKKVEEPEELPLPVAPIPVEELKEHVIAQGADMVSKVNETLTTVMQDLRQIPTDAQALTAASNLIDSYTGLLAQFTKTNEMYEKMRHEKEMLAMKLMADKTMNDDNNETALTMTREQLFAEIEKRKGGE